MGSATTGRIVSPDLVLAAPHQIRESRPGMKSVMLPPVRAAAVPVPVARVLSRPQSRPVRFVPPSPADVGHVQTQPTPHLGTASRPNTKGDERMSTPADHTTRAGHSGSVLLYRLATYWLPVLPGWLCWRSLQHQGYV